MANVSSVKSENDGEDFDLPSEEETDRMICTNDAEQNVQETAKKASVSTESLSLQEMPIYSVSHPVRLHARMHFCIFLLASFLSFASLASNFT